jgi:APA family basic amino acid/polyamine antiporter
MANQQGQLVRSVTLSAATILVISSVIGSGVYKKVAPMSDGLMSPKLVLLAWILGGMVSLFGALSNAEIAGMMADSGGEYVYFRKIYNKFIAFLWGWTTFAVIKTASISSIAYVFAQSFNSLIALPKLPAHIAEIEYFGIFKPFDSFGVKLLTIALILTLTVINTKGVKGGAGLSNWLTKLVIIGLSLIVVSGLFFGGGSWSNITTPSINYVDRGWFDPAFLSAMFTAMLAAFWGYEGWNTVGFMAGEIKEPNKNLPLALAGGLAVIIVSYLLVNFTYMYVMPMDQIIGIAKDKNQIISVEVVRSFAGDWGATLLSILILLTTLGCTNATILMPPRVYYAMARDGLFFKKAADIDPVTNTPNNAIWIQGIWACLLVLSGSFDQLTDMLIFAAFLFYGATALGVFILRAREPNTERPYRVWGYPFVPIIFILFCVGLVANTIISQPREAGIGLALILSGIPFYWYWTRGENEEEKNK